MVKVGDSLPDVELYDGSPGNKTTIAKAFGSQKKGLLIGVPGAFSPACSASHIPGYLNSPKLKDAGAVVVISVNDPFVMKAWSEELHKDAKGQVKFLADPHAELTNALDMAFDATAFFGQPRSKRFVLEIQDGKITDMVVEPDNTGVTVTSAEKVLG